MKKAEIRKLALNQRASLPYGQIDVLSTRLLQHFLHLDLSKVKILHIFLPIEEKSEPNTFLIIDWLTKNHPEIKIIVPKADFENALMTNHLYLGKGDLKKNIYNILEPQKAEIHTGDIDLVIVPLLAFDLRGYRVGYGKGFYDRFLSNITTRKIGLSLFEPIAHIDDVYEKDIKLDLCITPAKVYTFPAQKS